MDIIEKKYYVYILCDPRFSGEEWGLKYKPFYVGKGSGRRAIRHLEESSKEKVDNVHKFYKINKIRKENLEPIIEYYATSLAENEAYEVETILIKKYGRKGIDNNGILTNLIVDGGRPKIRSGPMSQEQKDAIRRGNTGKKRTPEQSKYLSEIRTGKKRNPFSETQRNTISKSLGGDITKNLKGQYFGHWLVLEKSSDQRNIEKRGAQYIFWKCRCSCPKQTEREVNQKNLLKGKSKSCGCTLGRGAYLAPLFIDQTVSFTFGRLISEEIS